MTMTTRGFATWRGWTIGVVLTALVAATVQTHAAPQEAPTVRVWGDPSAVPDAWPLTRLLAMEAVRQELKLPDAEKKVFEAIEERQGTRMRKDGRDTRDRTKMIAARRAINKEAIAEVRANLQPEQWERLDQIQLQAQGPLAFDPPRQEAMVSAYSGPLWAERLKLSDDQVSRIRAIVEEGNKAIRKAARFPIPMDPKAKPSSEEDVRKLVESSEYQAAREKARLAGRGAVAAVIRRIEEVLTEPQRQAYHKILGAPFDLSRLLRVPPEQARQIEVALVAQALGIARGGQGGGQRADPNFNTKVAHPAYAGGPGHPRVLFDEAHHNFHTASGRYKPFAELITSDGYQVIPNKEKFTRDVLSKGDILVIANALGAERMGMPEASNPAFTDAECDAVRDWVQGGGSLLLITDHAPMGSAAQCLAKRFGVNLSTGAVGDPKNSEEGETFLVFSRQNHLLGDHPITRGRDDSERVNKVQTFTGTSLKGPEGSVPILKLADTAVDHSFGVDNKEVSAAGRAQGLAFPFGQGRVVVMGEAAELSAQVIGADMKFGMNRPGIDNRQMALNILHWLSGLLEPREAALKKAG